MERGERAGIAVMEVGSPVKERKMLQTIKQLAETLDGPR